MIPTSAVTDAERVKFLFALAANVSLPNGLFISPWESNFLHSFTVDSRPSLWFTPPRRVAADKMRMKYGSEPEIGMPFPLPNSTARLPEAAAGCCQFIVRGDGLQRPCNTPAEQVRQNGFRYCAAHAEAVQRDLQRRGKSLALSPFKS